MSKINLHPTLPLNDFAKVYMQELQFGSEAPFTPQTATMEKKDLNWFGRCVKKIDKSNHRALLIARLALLVFLTLSLVGIPLVYLFFRELMRQKKECTIENSLIETLNDHNARINKRAAIVEKLGFQHFQQIRQLDLRDNMGDTGYIDFLVSDDLSANIMKGADKAGRAFISFKFRRMTEAPEHLQRLRNPFVLTIFERYQKGALWVSGSADNGHLQEMGGALNEENLAILRRVIAGQHPDYQLA